MLLLSRGTGYVSQLLGTISQLLSGIPVGLWVESVAHHILYFVQGVREIEEWMSHSSGLSLDELRPHMFLLRDRDATGHLLK